MPPEIFFSVEVRSISVRELPCDEKSCRLLTCKAGVNSRTTNHQCYKKRRPNTNEALSGVHLLLYYHPELNMGSHDHMVRLTASTQFLRYEDSRPEAEISRLI